MHWCWCWCRFFAKFTWLRDDRILASYLQLCEFIHELEERNLVIMVLQNLILKFIQFDLKLCQKCLDKFLRLRLDYFKTILSWSIIDIWQLTSDIWLFTIDILQLTFYNWHFAIDILHFTWHDTLKWYWYNGLGTDSFSLMDSEVILAVGKLNVTRWTKAASEMHVTQ